MENKFTVLNVDDEKDNHSQTVSNKDSKKRRRKTRNVVQESGLKKFLELGLKT